MMRTIVIFFLTACLGLLLQATLVHSISPSAISPDFIVVLVLYLALNYRNIWGLLGVFALGLLADFASAQFVGPYAAGAVAAYSLVLFISDKVFAERTAAVIILGIVSSAVRALTYLVLLLIYVDVNLFRLDVIAKVLLEALLTGLVAPFVFRLLQSMERPAGNRTVGATSFSWLLNRSR